MKTNTDKQIGKNTATALLFMLPFLLLYTVFTIWPVIQGLYVSLYKWGLMGKIRYTGAKNWLRLFHDKFFWQAMWHTTWFVIISVPALVIGALLLAFLANRKTGCQKFLRVSYYLPNVLSVTVISFMFKFMFDPYVGFIVALLHSLHILAPDKTILFLTDPGPIWTVVTSATVWWTVGFSMMLYIAAMQDIPTSVYEAADLDGASKARQLWSITIPLLAPTTFLILLLQILASFKVFGQVQLISGGGPGNMTRPLVEYIYDTGFSKNELGYASAMSYALFIVLVIVTVIQLWFQNRKGAEQ